MRWQLEKLHLRPRHRPRRRSAPQMGLQSAAGAAIRSSQDAGSGLPWASRRNEPTGETERRKMKPTTTDTGLARHISQKMRAPARLATATEIRTREPQKFSSRRQRITAEQAIAAGERIFGK